MNQRSMPAKQKTKSVDNICYHLLKYEQMALLVRDKIRSLLEHIYTKQLLDDLEFIIISITLFRMNIVPEEITHIRKLYIHYSNILVR